MSPHLPSHPWFSRFSRWRYPRSPAVGSPCPVWGLHPARVSSTGSPQTLCMCVCVYMCTYYSWYLCTALIVASDIDLTGLPADISAHDCSSLLLRLGLVDWEGKEGWVYTSYWSLYPTYPTVSTRSWPRSQAPYQLLGARERGSVQYRYNL